MKKIGIIGGTFDPFHNGHLSIAKAAKEQLGLETIYLMPANVQPFKIGRTVTPKEDRLNMARLMEREEPFLKVSTIELFGEDITYTYETICKIRKDHPDDELIFIMGTDSLMSIENWYMGKELLQSCSFAVGVRPGHTLGSIISKINYLESKYGGKIYLLHNNLIEVSSTEIKERVKRREKIDHLVPKGVERYINERRLYL